ncbi:MAG: 2-amino-4-hydroxy-6-hydroxymethyldihydropteridine diphosphokinase [Gammaproteobacteria bacterium]|nr:MAG: 2-amino-4-hydroxy-6-hydroxymethyldihydropteridine diphosphokinase [Gammaproteobacteria bacterium]RLA24395.1 MAG: 2-amino-4-hydroxy-6-hydroxymethyldihydropteridine diphosphokinase [Gammaproteobacteria bacterium]
MTELFISIGSNIDRENNFRSALKSLEKLFGSIKVSSLYESESVGFSGAPFYNGVIVLQTDKTLEEAKNYLTAIENEHGRTRNEQKFSSRTLDLDLLLYGNLICPEKNIPRDEIESYAFVLEPLAEIAPTHLHPVKNSSYQDLWAQYDKTDLKQKRIAFSR